MPLLRRRRILTRDRSVPWGTIAVAGGCTAVGLYLMQAIWSGTRVHVDTEGIPDKQILTSQALADRTFTFAIDPTDRAHRAELKLDGKPVDEDGVTVDGATVSWRPGPLPEGEHKISLTVPRPAVAASSFGWRFTVDDTPPRLDVPAVAEPVQLCRPVEIRGRVEPGATLLVDGEPLKHKGSFTLRYAHPPSAPVRLEATDVAGNKSTAEAIVPVRYPGGQGVHVTAAAWGYEPLRRGIVSLIDARLVSTVQLDLKDEGGIVGYDSNVPLARQVGAVQPEYRIRDVVADLKRRGVRVIGRIVAFRDPQLATWAWNNNKRDWVVHAAGGGPYGGFTNPVHPEVHRYNLDVALEATEAGVDDILWDYIRRPEGDPATMMIPGLQGTSADGVVKFLAMTGAALREKCVYQGASVFGIAAARPEAIGQDVPRIARHVDYVAPMVYPSHWVSGEYNVVNPNGQPYDIVKASLADFKEKMGGTGKYLMPWLQDFTLGHPYGPREVRAQIDAAGELGVSDWLLWNAGASYTAGAMHPSLVRLRA